MRRREIRRAKGRLFMQKSADKINKGNQTEQQFKGINNQDIRPVGDEAGRVMRIVQRNVHIKKNRKNQAASKEQKLKRKAAD